MGIFSKFSWGLSKSRAKMSSAMEDMLDSFDEINDDLYIELEEILVMSDVGVYTALEIVQELKLRVSSQKIKRPDEVKNEVKEIVAEMLSGGEDLGLITKPSVLLVIGVNGVGKTTSIGKLAAKYKSEGKNVLLGAADTFRAAAIDQLDIWAKRTEVDIVKHKEGADPAAVVYDSIAAAKSRDTDIIIIDTAGRLHNKKHLMDELNKIYRVIDRELPYSDREVLLVLDATTGQNAVSQAKSFQEATDNEITGIILTKLDGTARGGVVLAIKNELKIPVKFIGVGEQVDDLQAFNPRVFADALFEEISDDLKEEESTYHDAIAAHQADYERIQRSGKIMEAQELNKIANFRENNTQEKKTLTESEATPIYEAELYSGEEQTISDADLREVLSEVAEAFGQVVEEETAQNIIDETTEDTVVIEEPVVETVVETVTEEAVEETVDDTAPEQIEKQDIEEKSATASIYDIFGTTPDESAETVIEPPVVEETQTSEKAEEVISAPVSQSEESEKKKKRGLFGGLFNRNS